MTIVLKFDKAVDARHVECALELEPGDAAGLRALRACAVAHCPYPADLHRGLKLLRQLLGEADR